MESLKGKYYATHPDEPVVLHRSEMVNALPPFQALKDPELRRTFEIDLLSLLNSWGYTVITVCLDKKHNETYTVWR